MLRRPLLAAALLAPLACAPRSQPAPVVPAPAPAARPVALDDLREGDVVHGFRAVAVYLDGADAPLGARLVHQATGFTLDYLRLDSAPQALLWVNSYPTSDQGEPHTQEHLILGKGNRGRLLQNAEAMALGKSSAFTSTELTAYHFHTIAGEGSFWTLLDNQIDALLNPDYTDEEIRREVRNFGLSKGPDGAQRLEEKGTIYNEMVRGFESPYAAVWRRGAQLLYGPKHPLALSAGGYPDAIRTMTPADIRTFHRDHYYPGNMTLIGAFPPSMALDDVLERTAAIVGRHGARTGHAMTEADLPPPLGAPAATIAVVPYPDSDAGKSSSVQLIWPATRHLDLAERILLELFVDAIAGDESTNLYRRLVDSRTRDLDVGATEVGAGVSSDPGQPVYLEVDGVAARALTEQGIASIRAVVHDELARIAALAPGDPELIALDQRIASRLSDRRSSLAKLLNSPPAFGFRGRIGNWLDQLHDLQRVPGFRKSLMLKDELARVDAVLAAGGNPWAARLAAWGLLELPHGLAAHASPELRQQLDRDRKARIDAEVQRLAGVYGTHDPAETLTRFRADYDAATARVEAGAGHQAMPRFIDTPPMTLDDELRYEVATVAGGVPLVASRIDSMTGGSAGLAFRLDAVPEADLGYLALLPTLITDAGLFADGQAMPSEQVKEALRREILSLSLTYVSNPRTGRVELLAQGAGNDVAESQRALAWIGRLIAHPDWRPANVSRLRDVVDQAITANRATTLRAEEAWVEDPATIYWRQRWPLFAHTTSFLTRRHDLYRLRWRLADPGDARITAAVAAQLRRLAPAADRLDRAHLAALAQALETPPAAADRALASYLAGVARLPAPARALIAQAGKDLRTLLADLPDDSLAGDWAYLCKQMATDLEAGAAGALAELDRVRRAVFHAGNARAWLVGSAATGAALRQDIDAVLAGLDAGPLARQHYGDRPFIRDRLRARRPAAAAPAFVGLVNPSTQSGTFVNSAPGATYTDLGDDALLDFLASNLYSGHGAHSMYMKTWEAGLAYGNGMRISADLGRVRYYADRCPELPQTLGFVIDQLRHARPDPGLVDYAIAQSFSSRVAATYEERARGIADDLADGVTPDVVRAFRTRLLALRQRPDLADQLFRRMPVVYDRVLPGFRPGGAAPDDDRVAFVVGPDAQLDAWARFLRSEEGTDAELWRLYPRDFWVVGPVR